MIYFDQQGYPVDRTGDGGDSAMRNGMLLLCGHPKARPVEDYEYRPGILRRHVWDYPWNYYGNFSRDQLMACLPGMSRDLARRVFWQTAKRFFFAQNFERDVPGSWKFPWPHDVDGQRRYFDFADPLLPQHVGAMIIAARLYALYPFLALAIPCHVIAIVAHKFSGHHEENQQIAECSIYGTLKLYKKIHPRWRQVSWKYWASRGELDYHVMLERIVDRA